MTKPVIHCVLGMHRSGTSLLTRCLALIGVELGPGEHLLAATDFNPTGFWEHEGIQKLNDEILAAFDGSWREVPELPPGWERDARLDGLRGRARDLIAADFAGCAMWGFKDPRICLTLPFWKPLLPGLRYVLCLRNPADVARSLEHTMPFEEAVALWLRYVEASLRHTAGGPRAVVFYEDLLADTAGEMRRLAGTFGIAPGAALEAGLAQAAEFARADMQHHRTDVVELMADDRVPFAAKSLYAALLARLKHPAGDLLEMLSAQALASHRAKGPHLGLKELFEEKPAGVIADISEHDLMHRSGNPANYFTWGEMAVRAIRLAMLAVGKVGFKTILDLPCGHGRVLRTLKAAFPGARLTACDLDRDGVDFCAKTFGATPVYSHPDPKQVSIAGGFDLIWCGSLLTHFDRERWPEFLRFFESLLAPRGLLVFTFHGHWIAERLQSGSLDLGIRREEAVEMLAEFDASGFSYRDYKAQSGFGISLSSPAWVCAQLANFPRLRLAVLSERGWFYHHDTIACQRITEARAMQ